MSDAHAAQQSTPIFIRAPRPFGLGFLLFVTLIYLFIEFAYSAWLIDVMGTSATAEQISKVEHWGRIISGFAAALLLWPSRLERAHSWVRAFTKLIVITAITMAAVYYAEKAFINTIVAHSSAESRAAAMTGSLLRQGMAESIIDERVLDGLWSSDNAQSTAAKAFLGVVATMAASSKTAREQTNIIAPSVVSGVIDNRTGGVRAEHERFERSQAQIKSQFAQYQKATSSVSSQLASIDAKADKAWWDYVKEVENQHPYWGRKFSVAGEFAPRRAGIAIRKKLRSKGVPVSDSWTTGDEAGFKAAYKIGFQERIEKNLKSKLDGLPVGLRLNAFAANDRIQNKWKQSLGYGNIKASLPIGKISTKQFELSIYKQVLGARTDKKLSEYRAKISDYGDDGKYAKEGAQAFKSMFAPVVALLLSMIGALTHIGKSFFLVLHWAGRLRFRQPWHKSAAISVWVLGVFAMAPYVLQTQITSHPTYVAWQSSMRRSDGNPIISTKNSVVSHSIDALIRLQAHGYPAFNLARESLILIPHASKSISHQTNTEAKD